MAKMKKAVTKVLEANSTAPAKQQVAVASRKGFMETKVDEAMSQVEFIESLRVKRIEVEKYQDRARRLVETMRVPDLTYIPLR